MKLLEGCKLCPRQCGVNRENGMLGYCGVTAEVTIARAALHMWEEPCISGRNGSGTVFFSGCPMKCVFCQNTQIAIGTAGIIISSFLKDFNKTSDDDNYFQLKTNPKTGEHYKPDVFQTAAAKNLYLGNDVLVTAPTGTGKTAIAHYATGKNLHEGKKTFYTNS